MYSKSDDGSAPASLPEQQRRVWSIARRFRALYAASTAALLLLTGGFLYYTLERSLDVRDHALLASKVQVLRVLLREEARHRDVLVSEVEHEATESGLRYYIRILDEPGRVLIETPGMKESVPAVAFGDPAPASAAAVENVGHHAQWREPFLLLSIHVPGDGALVGTGRIVQVALDTSADLELLRDYRRTLALVLGAGMAFAMVVGGALARKSTQPLIEITKSTQEVTANRLDGRIVVSRWPAELVELAVAVNAMLDRLQESFTRLSNFSGDLAHALRTPLSNLRGEAEVALGRDRSPQEYQQVLASSVEEYERLSRMVDGLLFIARADDPNAVVEHAGFDAGDEIEDVREFHQAMAAEHGVEVRCEGRARVIGDRMLFRRAVTNLVSNAIQHTPAGGNVCIALHSSEDGTLEVNVSDSGYGIEPENLPKIFDRFFRTDRSRASVAGGSGLGLAIVRSIMRLHRGTVHASSDLGRGTTITLRFPPVA